MSQSKTERADILSMVSSALKRLPLEDLPRVAKLVKSEMVSRTLLNDLSNDIMEEGGG